MFFVKQKTAYEMRISDWSSDVCSSDLREARKDDIAGDLAKARIGIQRCGLFMGTRIVPQDAGAQHLVVRVEQGRAVHLAGEADALHGRQFLRAFLLQPPDRLFRPADPVGCVLSGPAGMSSEERRVGQEWVSTDRTRVWPYT